MMNKSAQDFFDLIVAKEPHELNGEEVAFLRARESYLTGDQREKFAEVLKAPKAEKPAKDDK